MINFRPPFYHSFFLFLSFSRPTPKLKKTKLLFPLAQVLLPKMDFTNLSIVDSYFQYREINEQDIVFAHFKGSVWCSPKQNLVPTKKKNLQLKQYIEIVYLSTDPKSIAHEKRSMSLNNIMSVLWECYLVFQEQPVSKFVNWCTAQKFEFLSTNVKKHDSDIRSSLRALYVLRPSYKDK
ncbi:hypothetical protein EDC94DRAFT_683939 [Helicostylum pulchrum]|nr:hypothetical protein EDC94DRAFT_683939 [Helicostylum pulchrum]